MVDVELISPNEHFKSIYIWSNISWKLNENWQKESCTTRDVGKVHMQLGRKESKVIRFNLCPCKGTQRKREITQGEILRGEWTFQPTYWVPQSWGLTQETQVPFAGWRAGGINRRAEESLGSAFECVYTHLPPKQGGEGSWNHKREKRLASFLPLPLYMPQPELSESSSPTCFLMQLHIGARAWLWDIEAAHI